MGADAIGARLKTLRGAEPQASFAKKAGLYRQDLGRYEAGRVTPSPMALAKLAELRGASLHWLITGQGPMLAEGLKERIVEGKSESNPEMSEMLEAVQTIVKSNNRLVIQALKTNLEVFLRALDRRPRRPRK